MKRTIFLYSGEGTSNRESDYQLLPYSSHWSEIESILSSRFNLNLEQIWKDEIGRHRCPHSPLLTVVSQICLSDIWSRWGYQPDVVIGHSIGELAAAYRAGFYSLEDILNITYRIGQTAARLDGVMLHGELPDEQINALSVSLSSLNFKLGENNHVTVSGYADEMDDFLAQNPGFKALKPRHPWHHPDYGQYAVGLVASSVEPLPNVRFVSAVTAKFEQQLPADHWQRWLCNPMDFIRSMQAIKESYNDDELEIIEIGFHPVLDKCCDIFDHYRYVSSMFRGEDEIQWILHQRQVLDQTVFSDSVKHAVEAFRPGLDYDAPLAYQGFTSLKFAEFSAVLEPYFPTLAPQDFYRYKSVNQLIHHFGSGKPVTERLESQPSRNEVVIAGMSCKFPAAVENLPQFWDALLSAEDQVQANAQRGHFEAGFLSNDVTRFDHQFFNIPQAEAQTMDPQQILALELSELLWQDAAVDPDHLDRKRVGVYIGVWNQEYRGNKDSVYYPIGTNPSIIASRISYHYDLRGPSWVSNTACSSSLLAVHYAAKDIEAGRVDYAIAGGVNMILGDEFTDRMRESGFLSRDDRCKTFDDSANGYVRAEGGGLVLLANKNLVSNYYAELLGSAVNQNGGRSSIISAPHPEAQEELIVDACRDAAIRPQDIDYIECHGTGTKIGDPIEISAIQRTVAAGRKRQCYLGSVKSNIGHLESAAGIAGLIKSVLILHYGLIPPNLHFNRPNQYIDFESYNLKVANTRTEIDRQSHIGISSFGFGGSNAHIIIKGVDEGVRKNVADRPIPFDRGRSAPLQDYYRLDGGSDRNDSGRAAGPAGPLVPETVAAGDAGGNGQDRKLSRQDVRDLVQGLFYQLTNIESIDPDVELIEQGLDSMSITEFVSQLQTKLDIEIDPDLIFEYPLPDQLIDEIHALI